MKDKLKEDLTRMMDSLDKFELVGSAWNLEYFHNTQVFVNLSLSIIYNFVYM